MGDPSTLAPASTTPTRERNPKMLNSKTVSAIKGNNIRGVALMKLGAYTGPAIDFTTDLKALGYVEFAIVSSEDGVGFAKSADVNKIKGWGDYTVDENWSNNEATITINIISFKDLQSLKFLFGAANVTKVDGVIRVKVKTVGATERISLVIQGIDKNGEAAILFAREASLDPNFEFTWNDADPVSIPAVVNLYAQTDNELAELIFESDDTPPVGGRVAASSKANDLI